MIICMFMKAGGNFSSVSLLQDFFNLNFKFYDFVLKQLKNYYKLIQKSQFIIYDIIDCKSIQKKCIIIESEKNEFITEMSYEFEHD